MTTDTGPGTYSAIAGIFTGLTGITKPDRVEGLFELLTGAYREDRQIRDRIGALAILEGAGIRRIITSHSPGGRDYLPAHDSLYRIPEVLVIADLALTRPRMLAHLTGRSDFSGIPAMADEFSGLRGVSVKKYRR